MCQTACSIFAQQGIKQIRSTFEGAVDVLSNLLQYSKVYNVMSFASVRNIKKENIMQLKSLPWSRASKTQYVVSLISALIITSVCWWYIFFFYKNIPTINAYIIVPIFIFIGNSILCFIVNHSPGDLRRKKSDIAYSVFFFSFSCVFFFAMLLENKILPLAYLPGIFIFAIVGLIACIFVP